MQGLIAHIAAKKIIFPVGRFGQAVTVFFFYLKIELCGLEHARPKTPEIGINGCGGDCKEGNGAQTE
jgi:hypothetical protein